MVENLRTRVVVIVLLLLGALFFLVRPWFEGGSPFVLGNDLRGGVSLRYQFPELAEMPSGQATEELKTIQKIYQNRLDAIGIKEVSVRPIGVDQIEIVVPGVQESEVDDIKLTAENLGQLEFRLQAYTEAGVDYENEKKRFDEELQRRKAAGEKVTRLTVFSELTEGLRLEAEGVSFRWRPLSNDYAKDFCLSRTVSYDPDPDFWNYWELIRFEAKEGKFFTGSQISQVSPGRDENGLPAVAFEMRAGRDSQQFADFTEDNKGRGLTILLNGEVNSIATIQGRIPGSGVITGGSDGFRPEELRRLIAVIKSGSLSQRPVLASQTVVGPQLGETAIRRGIGAGTASVLLVMIFILLYYRLCGVVAIVSMVVNFLLLLGAMAMLGATLTLPGMAGLILTVGMAVDSNILIFERIREEMEKEKALPNAVKAGFDRAFLTILDSNLTTLLTAALLFRFGTSAIRGFAVTLSIGLATSMFAALYFSRTMFGLLLPRIQSLSMGKMLSNPNYRFLAHQKKAIAASAVIIALGCGLFMFLGPEKYGIDFTGGYEVQLTFVERRTQPEVLGKVQERFPNAEVISVGGAGGGALQFQIMIKLTDQDARKEEFSLSLKELFKGELVADPIPTLDLGSPDDNGRVAFQAELRFDREIETRTLEEALKAAQLTVSSVKVAGSEAAKGSAFSVAAGFPDSPGRDVARTRLAGAVRGLSAEDGKLVRLNEPVTSEAFVGPRAGTELRDAAIRSIIFSIIGIILYVRIRFRHYTWGIGASIALLHDVLVALAFIALVQWLGVVSAEVDLAIVAAFLTIIGYSINDTIVIFDRVRENLPRYEGKTLEEIIDLSINQTLSRTILTSLTVLFSVVILFAFNFGQRNVLEGFSFAMLVGVIAGTYSTVFIAAPVAIWLGRREEAKRARREAAKNAL